MNRGILLILFCFLISFRSNAQDKQVSSELNFARYLATNNLYNDQIYILKTLLNNKKASLDQKDSIHYALGKSYYQLQFLDSSAWQYQQVSSASTPLYAPSIFWNSYLHNHLGHHNNGRNVLVSLQLNESKLISLKKFQLAGNALLRRDYKQFHSNSVDFNSDYFQFASQEKILKELHKNLSNHKRKSPTIAGLMSAIIPGSGKIYSGKLGQGIATIVTTTIMGLQTYEGYRKDGADSPRFIIYASLLSTFYVANVWGSILSVNVREREFNDTINKEILFSMHIPLRTIFN